MTGAAALFDTIVAPITQTGGAVAVVRLSGAKSVAIAEVVSDWRQGPAGWATARLAQFRHGDEGIVTAFQPTKSYTGDETVEMSIHGSQASVGALLEACHKEGARLAEPGEFTYRAFMNGRIDLTQAEGVRDTVLAKTEAQLRQANSLRDGHLREQVAGLQDQLLTVLAAIEASTDFSEEVGELDRAAAQNQIGSVQVELSKWLALSQYAALIREGATVALIGRPNVGKSSLLNALTGTDRSIVTAHPGTTRDTVSETIDVQGIVVRFIDTAGIRESLDEIERLGVERSLAETNSADVVWFVYDASQGWTEADEAAIPDRPVTLVANKCDLLSEVSGLPREPAWPVSALTREGVADLLATLVQDVPGAEPPPVNRRHSALIVEALESLDAATNTLASAVPDDMATVHIRSAIRILGEVTGKTASHDVIERVFQTFCIGK